MSVVRIRFVGKLPFNIRPLRGARAKNKRKRKKYHNRMKVRRWAEKIVAAYNQHFSDLTKGIP